MLNRISCVINIKSAALTLSYPSTITKADLEHVSKILASSWVHFRIPKD